MNKTSIEYLTHTWNPIAMKCSPVSDGCRNCWHLAMAKRLAGNLKLPKAEQFAYADCDAWKRPPVLKERELSAPLHLKKPARIGTMFMGDLFHKDVPWNFQIKVFETMANAGRHTYFILTKRPEEMRKFLQGCEDWDPSEWPHVWLGVSCEDQKTADDRIPILCQIPATKKFISIEPMLESIHFYRGWFGTNGINWVICGAETGAKARPLHPNWVKSVVQQCKGAGVPLFFKSWGMWIHDSQLTNNHLRYTGKMNKEGFYHLGFGKAGHLIDGKEYREIP